MYYATAEKPDGTIETINGVIEYELVNGAMYLAGSDFEMWLSLYNYAHIEIQEGSL